MNKRYSCDTLLALRNSCRTMSAFVVRSLPAAACSTRYADDIEQRIAAASPEQLELWADRVLSVATLADLLAD